jgi:hypothetical protein
MKNLFLMNNIKNPKECGIRKVLPHNVKKPFLMMLLALGLTPTFTSCEKDNSQPDQLTTLRADSTRLAGEVRAAVLPAKTIEHDITTYFNMLYNQDVATNGAPENLYDSSKTFKRIVEAARAEAASYNATLVNNTTMSTLYTYSDTFIITVDKIQEVLANSK